MTIRTKRVHDLAAALALLVWRAQGGTSGLALLFLVVKSPDAGASTAPPLTGRAGVVMV